MFDAPASTFIPSWVLMQDKHTADVADTVAIFYPHLPVHYTYLFCLGDDC